MALHRCRACRGGVRQRPQHCQSERAGRPARPVGSGRARSGGRWHTAYLVHRLRRHDGGGSTLHHRRHVFVVVEQLLHAVHQQPGCRRHAEYTPVEERSGRAGTCAPRMVLDAVLQRCVVSVRRAQGHSRRQDRHQQCGGYQARRDDRRVHERRGALRYLDDLQQGLHHRRDC